MSDTQLRGRRPPLPWHPMTLTIAFTTCRAEPRLDWLIDGIEVQAIPGDKLELVVIDAFGRRASEIGYRPLPSIARLVEASPKPCVWQGPQRLTSRDYWAASSARNTAIALCRSDYVAFLDDRCRLGPRWLDAVRRGEHDRASVRVGPYDKLDEPTTILDHRLRARPHGLVGCSGGWLYGGNFALPLAWLLEVNGFEEGCDGLAGEDCILGFMLVRRGRRIDFVADMYACKERPAGTHHAISGAPKDDVANDRARAAMTRFGRRTRTEFTPDLVQLRERLAAGEGFPDVDPSSDPRDWYDGRPLREL